MSVWNRVLLGLIAVALVGFVYTAARTLKVQQYWGNLAVQYESGAKKLRAENERLLEGSVEGKNVELGTKQLRILVHRLTADRGRVWRNCHPSAFEGGQFRVTIEQPVPHAIADKARLFVLEQADYEKEGRYLGEFKAVGVDEAKKLIGLEPMMKLSQRELDRLSRSKGPWVLYENMPGDDHQVLAGMTREELKAIVPEESVAEYVRDGTPAAEGDAPDRVVNGKYVRELHDYERLFESFYVARTELVDDLESVKRDRQSMIDAVASAKKQQELSQQEVAALTRDVAALQRERDLVIAHRNELEKLVAKEQQLIEERTVANRAMAAQIETAQRAAAQQIDRRTNSMAQAGAGSTRGE